MKRFIIIAALATATSAGAQEFNGKCTDYHDKGKEACQATQWCVWREAKQITLPDGQTVVPKGSCAFKAHHAKAWAAKAQGQLPQQQ